jgi:hypothetical protein
MMNRPPCAADEVASQGLDARGEVTGEAEPGHPGCPFRDESVAGAERHGRPRGTRSRGVAHRRGDGRGPLADDTIVSETDEK